jgi:hypothetical protein
VLLEGDFLCKPFVAGLADKAPLPGVYENMPLEVEFSSEPFTADLAEIRCKFSWAISFDSFFPSPDTDNMFSSVLSDDIAPQGVHPLTVQEKKRTDSGSDETYSTYSTNNAEESNTDLSTTGQIVLSYFPTI